MPFLINKNNNIFRKRKNKASDNASNTHTQPTLISQSREIITKNAVGLVGAVYIQSARRLGADSSLPYAPNFFVFVVCVKRFL